MRWRPNCALQQTGADRIRSVHRLRGLAAALGLAALAACSDGSGPDYAWNSEGRWSGDVEGLPLSLTLEEGDHQYAPTNATLTGSGVFTRGETDEVLTVASGLRSTNRVTLRLSGFVEGEGFLDVLLEDGNTEMRGELTVSGARYEAVLRRQFRQAGLRLPAARRLRGDAPLAARADAEHAFRAPTR